MTKVMMAAMKTTMRTRVKWLCPICTRKILTTTKILPVQIEQSHFTHIPTCCLYPCNHHYLHHCSNDLEFTSLFYLYFTYWTFFTDDDEDGDDESDDGSDEEDGEDEGEMTLSDLYGKNLDDDEDGEDFVEGDGEEEDDDGNFPAFCFEFLCKNLVIFYVLKLASNIEIFVEFWIFCFFF